MEDAIGRKGHFLNLVLLGFGLFYALIIPPTVTSILAFQSLNFSSAYGIFIFPIFIVEQFYHTSSSYPFVLALLLAWTSLPELVFLEVLLERGAKRPAGALLVFFGINLAVGVLSVVRNGT